MSGAPGPSGGGGGMTTTVAQPDSQPAAVQGGGGAPTAASATAAGAGPSMSGAPGERERAISAHTQQPRTCLYAHAQRG